MQAIGWEQTELDAAIALAGSESVKVVRKSLNRYFDSGLADRAREEKRRLEEEANLRLADQLGPETLERIRTEGEAALATLDDAVGEINAALRVDPAEVGVADLDEPEVIIGRTKVTERALLDTAGDWGAETRRLIARKKYR